MKRVFLIFLAVYMAFAASACGKKSDYKYTAIPNVEYFNPTSRMEFRGVSFTGGAIKHMHKEDLYGKDRSLSALDDKVTVMFDEGGKLLFPLCFDTTCLHEQDNQECFAHKVAYALSDVAFVAFDRIFSVYGGKIHVYTFDGTTEGVYEPSEDIFIRADGQPTEFFGLDRVAFSNNTLYFTAYGYGQGTRVVEGEQYNHWIVSFDMEKREFRALCNYTVPDPFGPYQSVITEFDGEYMGITHDNRFLYKINLSDGSYTEYDYAEAIDYIGEKYQLTPWLEMSFEALPVSGIIHANPNLENVYFDIETLEVIELDYVDYLKKYTYSEYIIFEGERYYQTDPTEEKLCFVRTSDGKTFEISTVFADGEYGIPFQQVYIESENGLIYKYFPAGKREQDDRYEVEINGVTEEYMRAARLVYVTKEDFFDGQIDDPWYYDAETGMFLQK
ncbi:MAG: hypothetical protein IKM29_05125 [Clostridia bacterium]|nr:hypothetical protein [Clostridia bacterium]